MSVGKGLKNPFIIPIGIELKKETKLKLNFTEVLQKEIHKLKILINEYETKDNPVKIKKESKKTNKSKDAKPPTKKVPTH